MFERNLLKEVFKIIIKYWRQHLRVAVVTVAPESSDDNKRRRLILKMPDFKHKIMFYAGDFLGYFFYNYCEVSRRFTAVCHRVNVF